MKNILILLIAVVVTASCSKDKSEVPILENRLIGTWELSGVDVAETADNDLKAAKIIADVLISGGCDLFTFTFEAGDVVTTESKLNNIVLSLDIECPGTTDVETGTWVLEGNELTTTDSLGAEETITIQLDGTMLTVQGEDLDVSYAGADVVFTKQ